MKMSKSYLILFLILIFLGCTPQDIEKETELRNIETVESYVETVLNNKHLDSLDFFFSSNFIRKVNNIDSAVNNAEMTANLTLLFKAFSDLRMDIDFIIAAKDKVYINWTKTGTNKGKFGDHPATGKKIKISGISRIDLNEEGKIVSENLYYNELSLMQQLDYTLPLQKNE